MRELTANDFIGSNVDSWVAPRAANLNRIPGLKALQAATPGDPRVCVAILDGPINRNHPALAHAFLARIDMEQSAEPNSPAAFDHGTAIASIIFGHRGSRVPGLAPRCRGLIIPIFDADADGILQPCSQERLARAIELAIAHGADIINISGGQLAPPGAAEPVLASAVAQASQSALIVAAAGNDGCECLHVPGGLPSVLAVGAMNDQGKPLPFSNWGESYRRQGLLAPGEQILCAAGAGHIVTRSGTSYATAVVSGALGLLLSLYRRQGRCPTPPQIRQNLLESAIRCPDDDEQDCRKWLAGRLNLTPLISDVLPGVHHVSDSQGSIEREGTAPHMPTESRSGSPPDTYRRQIPATAQQIAASDCECGCSAAQQLAYVIGTLAYDFEGEARRDSIQQAFDPVEAIPYQPNVSNPYDLLRHLRGFEEIKIDMAHGCIKGIAKHAATGFVQITIDQNILSPEDTGREVAIEGETDPDGGVLNYTTEPRLRVVFVSPNQFYIDRVRWQPNYFNVDCARWYLPRGCKVARHHQANVHSLPAVTWTLNRGLIVLYALRPQGSYSEEAYQELTELLMNHLRLTQESLNLYYFDFYGENRAWMPKWNPCFYSKKEDYQLPGPPLAPKYPGASYIGKRERTERVAVPGVVQGEAFLRGQQRVPILVPEMRGVAEWSRERLVHELVSAPGSQMERKIGELLDRLDEDVRNPGLAPADRALNFASTQQREVLKLVQADLEGDFEVDAVLPPRAAQHCRPGSDCWDVEISFFNPENVQAAPILVRQSVDVSDVIPVLVDVPRRFRRRHAMKGYGG